MQENQYDVTFIVNDNLPDEYINYISVKSTGMSYGSNRVKRIIFGVYKVFKLALEEDSTVYHLHDPELLLVALIFKKKGKKVIFDSHEYYYEQIKNKKYLPKGLRNIIAYIYNVFETYVCKRIDGVITPCTISGKHIFEGRCRDSAFVNNFPRIEEFENRNVGVIKYDKRKHLCYSGSLTYNRGISQLTEACNKANETICLAGRFESDLYKNEILESVYRDSIDYKGVLNRQDIYKLYSECAIGAATLLNVGQYAKGDNLPTKVYEYMAMEMPVIISNFPYYKELIDEYSFGVVVDPSDSEDIAEKIIYLLEHKQEAERMGKRGRELVYKLFNWKEAEKELVDLYNRILNQ